MHPVVGAVVERNQLLCEDGAELSSEPMMAQHSEAGFKVQSGLNGWSVRSNPDGSSGEGAPRWVSLESSVPPPPLPVPVVASQDSAERWRGTGAGPAPPGHYQPHLLPLHLTRVCPRSLMPP